MRKKKLHQRKESLPTTEIVKVEAPRFAVAPKILETARDMEQVRRFVMRCLNVDYQRLAPGINEQLAKIYDTAKSQNDRELTKDEKNRVYELRDRLTELEVDWGTIPGSKPFLKQPGAEKFMLWLNIKPHYHKTLSELGNGHLEILCYCTFHVKQGSEEIFEGPEASCSTMETNYRYIWAEAGYLPQDDEVTKGYQTKMGQWRYVDDWKHGRKVGRKKVWFIRVENPNPYNERNKCRQIGQKRALVKGVRGLGAMSELFAAGPDEWDTPPDEDEPQPDSPGVDKDYTAGGRKIYVDGVSPSGREQTREREMRREQDKPPAPDADAMEKSKARKTWCERHSCDFAKCPADEHSAGEMELMEEAEERAKAAAATSQAKPQEKASQPPQESQQPSNTAGAVEIVYASDHPGPYKSEISPMVIGDLDAIHAELKSVGVFWYESDSFYHIKQTDLPRLLTVMKEKNFSVKITRTSSGGVSSPDDAQSEARPPGNGGSSGAASQRQPDAAPTKKPKPAAKEPVLLHGVIERVNFVTTNDGKVMAYVTIKGKKKKYDLSSWSKTINEFIEKGKGKTADVYVLIKGKYRNLVGLKRIGSQEFVEGKVPVIQQQAREAGLFKGES